MKARADIQWELEQISKKLAELPMVQPFKVPEGYFDAFPGKILKMAQNLEAETAVDEISSLSPLLAGLSRSMPMKAPEGYFETLNVPVETPVKAQAPVVSMKKNPFRLYAVAASVVAILGLGGLLLKMNLSEKTSLVNVGIELPKVSETEMDEFLNGFPDLSVNEPIVVAGNPSKIEDMISDIDDQGLKEFLLDQPETTPVKLN